MPALQTQAVLAQDACSTAFECRDLHLFGALAHSREYGCPWQDVSGRPWMCASSSEAQPSTAVSGTRGDWGRGCTEGSISNESHSLMRWTLPSSPLPSHSSPYYPGYLVWVKRPISTDYN